MSEPVVMVLLIYLKACLSASASAASDNECHIGSYRLSDGSTMDVAPSIDDTLRWRLLTARQACFIASSA